MVALWARGTTVRTVSYGGESSQVADLYLPDGDAPAPVVVLLHGGFWQHTFGRQLMQPLAEDLVGDGWVAYNLEYRRVGGGGGWPATFEDVAAGIDGLADLPDDRLDLDRVVTVGHSSGGHLALWAATRGGLPGSAPGAGPVVEVRAAVGQAAVSDLARAADERLGGRATRGLLGGRPPEVPDRYAVADPAARLPLGLPVLLVHTRDDTLVPGDMSRRFADAARQAGDRVELALVDGDHFSHLGTGTDAWRAVRDWLEGLGAERSHP